ncbi:MAG: ZIP family magnesium transporter, partial [Gemmatimonadetes bacterium]|nr:ZIP family magnesium transporter [Gemmatimonadota bacterium]NIQ53503.1 ZIP family magnesium transporter [Gemmatimonadota bacterium]NIU72074.1 ZIP family magnesium transporter [Gammaproteobacteria bacterium]NIX48864.1 ZIP family magnesium transporter [Gemmatimonadota bacterium]
LAAAANIAGGLLVTSGTRRSPAVLGTLIAFGGGFMLCVTLLEMTPVALEVRHGVTALLL